MNSIAFNMKNNLIETVNLTKAREFELFGSKNDKKMLTERKKTKLKKISPGMGDLKSLMYFHLLAT